MNTYLYIDNKYSSISNKAFNSTDRVLYHKYQI